jgi:predicted permease
MGPLIQDVRYSLRSLSRQPGFVVAVVLSLALGIGVNTAIFSALNALLWRPLALRDLDRTVIVFHATPNDPDQGTSYPAYQHYRARTDIFSKVMAFSGARPLILTDGDRRDQIYGELVTPGFFSMSDIDVRLGRGFEPDADRTLAPQFVVVLSHAFWLRRFSSDAGVVGKAVVVNGYSFTVVGVGRPGFTGLDPEVSADVWMPLTTWAHLVGEPVRLTSAEHWLTTAAQLAPGVTVEQARLAMAAAGQAEPSPAGQQTRVRPARQRFAETMTEILALGAGAFSVGLLVLTLACANVTNLLMARAAARQKEMSVRLTLGSGRLRLVRLWLTESGLLCAVAGGLGLIVAMWLLDLVVAFRPPTRIGDAEAPILPIAFRLDLRSLAFTFGISMLAALAVGSLAGLPGSQTGRRRFAPGFNLRSAVIALQMALSLILLIPCGLFVRSWLNAFTIPPGFAADHVLLLPISANQAGIRVEKPAGFDEELADRVTALPGVESATVMDPVPLWFGGNNRYFTKEGGGPSLSQRVGVSQVGARYFGTMRIRLLLGRDFTSADTASAPRVAIVNETLARRFWPGGNAVGQRIGNREESIEVVGIASDSKYRSLAETSQPFVYLPLAQAPTTNPTLSLAVRTTGDPMRLRTAVEREVKALVPGWPSFQFRTLDEGLTLQQTVPRVGATLLGVLGLFGLLLAAVGISGVMSFVVKQRTREIGIRLAIGAPTFTILTLLVRQGMAVCVAGAAVGITVALLVSPFLSDVLYGVSGADPLVFTAAPLVLLAVALLACYVPARHAARLNALDALRYE